MIHYQNRWINISAAEKRERMIYIIDDDKSVCNSFMWLLRSYEFDVQTFSSAEEFLQSAILVDNDCIVLDIRMPGMSGFDLMEKLNARGNKAPIVIVSALNDRPSRQRASELKAKAFLGKPVDDQALIDTICWVTEWADRET